MWCRVLKPDTSRQQGCRVIKPDTTPLPHNTFKFVFTLNIGQIPLNGYFWLYLIGMGGIAGLIRFDGGTLADHDRAALTTLLNHRGPATSQLAAQGVLIAFGGVVEASPATPIYAAVDADVFMPASAHLPFTSNYNQKGPAGLNDLNADFAVALWDVPQQTLVCARDILGVKPLYYVHQPGRFVAFASEIKVLLALHDVIIRPNDHKFREYLTWTTTYVPYSAETFYETIYSVLPGHYVQVTAHEVRVRPYCTIDFGQFDHLNRPEDYASFFHDQFTEAIDQRIRGKKRVGSHLSGGLDSSSVSCVAQSLLARQQRPSLHTFNIDPELASTDESAYVRTVVDQWHPQHHTVHPVADVLASVLKINALFDRPEQFIIPSSFHLSVSEEARHIGCDLLLTGHDGDSVIATGFDWLDALLDTSDWANLEQAARQYFDWRHPSDDTATKSSSGYDARFENYALGILGSNLKKRFSEQSLPQFLATLGQQKQLFNLSPGGIVAYCAKRITDKLAQRAQFDSAFTDEFRQRVAQRPQLTTEPLTTALSEGRPVPAEQILNTTNVICNEQLNHIGAHYGHSYSFPFFDKRIVQLGLATPLAVCFDNGRGRGLIRNGLRDTLPAAVIGRLTKTNFVEYSTLSAQQLYRATHAQFSLPSHPIWGVIDQARFAKIVGIVFNPKMPINKKTRYNWLLSRIIYLALWLDSLPKGS